MQLLQTLNLSLKGSAISCLFYYWIFFECCCEGYSIDFMSNLLRFPGHVKTFCALSRLFVPCQSFACLVDDFCVFASVVQQWFLFQLVIMSHSLIRKHYFADGCCLVKKPCSVTIYQRNQYDEEILKKCRSVHMFVCNTSKMPTFLLLTVE